MIAPSLIFFRRAPTFLCFPARKLQQVRAALHAWEDPLGEAFCRIRNQELRRPLGATYTPKAIVDAMTAWAAKEARDPLATLMTRAAAAVLGFSKRLTIKRIDYRELILPVIAGPTLFIGNPPYVRHHDIAAEWKRWFAETARGYGFAASGLAGLHVHFFMKTRPLVQRGDFGAFITAAEWLDVNYG